MNRILFAAVLLAVSGYVSAATGAAEPEKRVAAVARGAMPADQMASLRAVLQAASARKRTGSNATLRNNVYLHGRPTGDGALAGLVPAGTVVRQSAMHVVNAAGTWRHVETMEGADGWLLEADLDP